MNKRTIWCALLWAAAGSSFLGCNDEGAPASVVDPAPDDDGDNGDPMTGDMARVRVWHLAAAAGDVDVLINGEPALEDFEFEANTDYIDVPAGSLDVAVAPAGMSAAIIEDAFALGADERWTIVVAQLQEAGGFAFLPIQEDTSALNAGAIAFRFFHAAYAVPTAVDVHNASDPTLPELIDGIAQGEVATERLEVPNAAYDFGLDADDDGIIDFVTGMPIAMPAAGASVTVGAISAPGEAGATETKIVFLVNSGSDIHDEVDLETAEFGAIRFWHLAAALGTVDIFMNGVAVAPGIDFKANSPFTNFLVGSYDIAIGPAGMTAEEALITSPGFVLGADQSFTLLATQLNVDETAGGALRVLPIEEDTTAPAPGNIRFRVFRVFHASYAVDQPVSIHSIDGGANPEVVEAVEQGAVAPAPGLELPSAAYTLGVDVGDDGIIDFETAEPVAMPPDGALITIGAVSEPGQSSDETSLILLVNDDPTLGDTIALVPF